MPSKTKAKFSEMSFRFPGQMTEGKFELTCACGHYSGRQELTGDGSSFQCEECGLKYRFQQQSTHFHLFVTS